MCGRIASALLRALAVGAFAGIIVANSSLSTKAAPRFEVLWETTKDYPRGFARGDDGSLYTATKSPIIKLSPPQSSDDPWIPEKIFRLNNPKAIAIDPSGVLYVVAGYPRTKIYRLLPPKVGDTAWTREIVHTLPTGDHWISSRISLTFGPEGTIYGAVQSRGRYGPGDPWTAFKLTPKPDGSLPYTYERLLKSGGQRGYLPSSTLILDANGLLYGTTLAGGKSDLGTVFRLSPSSGEWKYTTLHHFDDEGHSPGGDIVLDSTDAIIGAAYRGFQNGCGGIYRLERGPTGWRREWLRKFTDPADGCWPLGVALGTDDVVYGTSQGGGGTLDAEGTAFKLMPPAPGGSNWEFHRLAVNNRIHFLKTPPVLKETEAGTVLFGLSYQAIWRLAE